MSKGKVWFYHFAIIKYDKTVALHMLNINNDKTIPFSSDILGLYRKNDRFRILMKENHRKSPSEIIGNVFSKTHFFKKHTFSKNPHFQKTHFFKNPLFQKPTFSKTHFFKNPLFSKNTLFQNTFFSKTHFFQKNSFFKKQLFQKNPLFQKPL